MYLYLMGTGFPAFKYRRLISVLGNKVSFTDCEINGSLTFLNPKRGFSSSTSLILTLGYRLKFSLWCINRLPVAEAVDTSRERNFMLNRNEKFRENIVGCAHKAETSMAKQEL